MPFTHEQQMELSRRVFTDQKFRADFLADPAKTALCVGAVLSDAEIAQVADSAEGIRETGAAIDAVLWKGAVPCSLPVITAPGGSGPLTPKI